jgi:hypothetical protein
MKVNVKLGKKQGEDKPRFYHYSTNGEVKTISVTTNKNPMWILCDMSAISKIYRILKWDGGLKNRSLLRWVGDQKINTREWSEGKNVCIFFAITTQCQNRALFSNVVKNRIAEQCKTYVFYHGPDAAEINTQEWSDDEKSSVVHWNRTAWIKLVMDIEGSINQECIPK